MAILIQGKSRCKLCGQVIRAVDEAVMFSPFISNEADPLHIFSDAAIHASCFRKHSLAHSAQKHYEEFRNRTNPKSRRCFICRHNITAPDNFLAFGHLAHDPNNALYPLNYAQFHRSCIAAWPELPEALRHLQALSQSGAWSGAALGRLIQELQKIRAESAGQP